MYLAVYRYTKNRLFAGLTPARARLWFIRAALLLCCGPAVASLKAAGVGNSWTSATSGNWQDASSWSLGVMPAANQSIFITNNGYKAVGVSATTASSFPTSMTIGDLIVGAPNGSLSTLLLNYAGTSVPLRVLSSVTLGNNGSLQNYYSSLQVDGSNGGQFVVGSFGQFIQEGGLTVVTPPVKVVDGIFNVTNATLNLGGLAIGNDQIGPPGSAAQSGGTLLSQSLTITNGTFTLAGGGTLYALNGTAVFPSGTFTQASGSNYGDLTLTGPYYMKGGLAQGNKIIMGQLGNFAQSAGTVAFSEVDLSAASYQLTNGSLYCGTLNMTTNALFAQRGGTCVLTNTLLLSGDPRQVQPQYNVEHDMYGGEFFAPSLVVSNTAQFQQSGGWSHFSNSVSLIGGNMWLLAGRLTVPNLGVGDVSTFIQDAGTNEITGVLSISGTYRHEGGLLSIGGMYLRGYMPIYWGGVVSNSGYINMGGLLQISTPQSAMGAVSLGANATVEAMGTSVHFADSSSLPWDTNSTLVIQSWGWGGPEHIYFGTNSAGLTPAQLARVRFGTPHWLPEGNYPARILSTGEVVPAPILVSERSGNQLKIYWSDDAYRLLSSTNVQGPYSPVAGATSPYTEDMTSAPQRFFIIQSQ